MGFDSPSPDNALIVMWKSSGGQMTRTRLLGTWPLVERCKLAVTEKPQLWENSRGFITLVCRRRKLSPQRCCFADSGKRGAQSGKVLIPFLKKRESWWTVAILKKLFE